MDTFTKNDPNVDEQSSTDIWMLMRIFIGESDKAAHGKFKGKPLWEALLNDFRERGLAGCTVIRAIAGFGASAKARNILSEYLSSDLPIVIEVVDRESKIRNVMPDLEEMIGGGMVTLEKVDMVMYRSGT
jgi:PII-like signaling protein